jgi:uncharacterized membrane protein
MEPKPEFQGDDKMHTSTPEAEVAAEPVTTSDFATREAEDNQAVRADGWEDHKVIAIIGYVFPILFFLPLINQEAKDSAYARFHANQQLNLLIAGLGFYAVLNFFIAVGMSVFIISLLQLVPLFLFALAIIGILGASKGEMKELPLIGQYHLLK